MVVILNGAGSSGKSTIARNLLDIITEPTVYHGFDMIIPTLLPHEDSFLPAKDPDRKAFTRRLDTELYATINKRQLSLLPLVYEFIRPLHCGGFNVIVDTLLPGECIDPLFGILDGIPTYLVGIRCSEKELMRRERSRGDRKIGSAQQSNQRVHLDMVYDLEVDTAKSNADDCARRILNHVTNNKPIGFAKTKILRER